MLSRFWLELGDSVLNKGSKVPKDIFAVSGTRTV
jgi:hypothetical protein